METLSHLPNSGGAMSKAGQEGACSAWGRGEIVGFSSQFQVAQPPLHSPAISSSFFVFFL